MKLASLGEVTALYPHLAEQIKVKLSKHKYEIELKEIDFYIIECHDDPQQPLDESSIADILLTGSLRCHRGIRGVFGNNSACCCEDEWVPIEKLTPSPA